MRICRLNWMENVRELSGRLVKPESLSNSGGHMNSRVRGMLIALGLGLALATFAPSARAQEAPAPAPAKSGGGATVRAGYLTCHVESGWGFIFGSSRKMKCAYALQPGYTEYYTGSVTKFGADIGYLQSGVILWAVLAPTTNLGQGALAGHYGGATASAAIGVGAGANVLVGGFNSSIALQPVSIEGQNGLNVAAGVVGMTLTFDQNKPAKSS
jgi:Protein of unknown function (DUF992)